MPASFRLSDLLDTPRDPVTALRIELAKAEADLNGLISRIGAGHLDIGRAGVDPIVLARTISARVYELRHALDEARFACLPFETINGSELCTNDPDDMGDALHHALDRLRLGVDDTAAYRAPAHRADIMRTERALIDRSHQRGAALLQAAE